MARFIFVTFAFLGWAFYEMSGGADFDPEETRLARIDPPALVEEEKLDTVIVQAAPAPVPENVTRVALNLTSVDDVLRPAPTLRATPARATQVQEAVVTEAVSEAAPTIILPSLVTGAAVITPVEFGEDGAQSALTAQAPDLRSVTGNRVNVRGGPGTGYSIVTRLTRGDQVEILQDPGDGWVKLRPVSGGPVGWMADFLLNEG
ncbi:SH3 domain-containing protein [uncultured Tateyamaria sp.]|uniref:SH3 domain-containing protein n=1 Tax=uncultured Tateyamaria sp. TaxID=455651 RepID=UPI00260EB23E|nr:SH3 domain-containing protein [uncultured Tateyamaria sp.]